MFLAKLFKEFDIPKFGPSKIMCDSQSAIQQTVNAVDQHRCRHINLRQHFIRRQCHLGEIELEYVSTVDQLGDAFTKNLYVPAFEKLTAEMGVLPMPTA